jgi:hypothetical protein
MADGLLGAVAGGVGVFWNDGAGAVGSGARATATCCDPRTVIRPTKKPIVPPSRSNAATDAPMRTPGR